MVGPRDGLAVIAANRATGAGALIACDHCRRITHETDVQFLAVQGHVSRISWNQVGQLSRKVIGSCSLNAERSQHPARRGRHGALQMQSRRGSR